MSLVFQNIDPPSPQQRRGVHTRRAERGMGGQYRVAALFPEHFQSFTVALQFVFLNNSFGMHCLSYI
jgi:hypothetical protein